MNRTKILLEKLIKSWAQDHTTDYTIADFQPTPEAMQLTEGHLTWVIREGHANLNLQTLIDRLEVFMEDHHRSKKDGLWCQKCGSFCSFVEPNQENGGFVCYSCRVV